MLPSARAAIAAAQNAVGPPPTNVGQAPQPSDTVSSTVAAWPAVRRRTVRVIVAGCAGRGTTLGVVLTVVTGEVATSTVALVRRVKVSDCNWLFAAQPASRAVIVVRS